MNKIHGMRPPDRTRVLSNDPSGGPLWSPREVAIVLLLIMAAAVAWVLPELLAR